MGEDRWLPNIDRDLCTGCGDCIAICVLQALALENSAAVLRDPAACSYCASCERICPVAAIAPPYQIVFASSL